MEYKKITADEVCHQMFEGDSTSTYDITKLFEKEFQGKEIEWTGELDSIVEFNYDFIFRNAKGVKVNFNVHESGTGFEGHKLKAIVHFPSEMFEELKAMKGEKQLFCGKMIKIDPSSRQIYVSHGQLVNPDDKVDEDIIIEETGTEKKQHDKSLKHTNKSHEKIARKNSSKLTALGLSHEDLKRLQEKKKAVVFLIIAVIVAAICITIIIGMKVLIEGTRPKRSNKYKNTTRIHQHKINPSPINAPVPIQSPLSAEFNRIQRETKNMPQTSAIQIDEIIRLWQKFVNKNERKYPNDPKLKQAKELIKNLKELRKMYEI